MAEFDVSAQGLGFDLFDFGLGDLHWPYPAEENFPLINPPSPRFSLDASLPLLSPPDAAPEQSAGPSTPRPRSPGAPSEDAPIITLPPATIQPPVTIQPPATVQQPATVQPPATTQPAPPAPLAQGWQPNAREISQFDYCPFTEHNRVCGFVSWKSSGNKAVERHLKREHFDPGSTSSAWKCPNQKCKSNVKSFGRRDSLLSHRNKSCNPYHRQLDPNYTFLPPIQVGNDTEVKEWIKAGAEQRKSIKMLLRSGTPWSIDLLQPTHL